MFNQFTARILLSQPRSSFSQKLNLVLVEPQLDLTRIEARRFRESS